MTAKRGGRSLPRGPLAWVLAGALLLRLALVGVALRDRERSLTPDSVEYVELARALISHRGFTIERELTTGEPIVIPEIFRTPGYPLFLAAGLRLGDREWLPLVLIVQALLGAATCVLVAWIALEMGVPPGTAVVAAVFLALDPASAVQSAFVLSETLATVLLALFLALAVRFARAPRLVTLAAACAVLVAAVHMRPVLAYLALILAVLVCVRFWKEWQRLLAALAVIAAVAGAGLGGWMARNMHRTGYSGLSPVSDYALLFHAAGIEARATGGDTDQIMERYRRELAQEFAPDFKWLHQGEWYRAMRAKARAEIGARWRDVPAYAVRGMAKICTHVDHQNLEQATGGLRLDAAERERPPHGIVARIRRLAAGHPWILAAVLLQLALTAVMWCGVAPALGRTLAALRSRVAMFQLGLLFSTAALGLVAGALPNAQVRFRLPLLPALLPLMAAGFAWPAPPGGVRRSCAHRPQTRSASGTHRRP